jgi:GNAT superfamily N-acetyltransferase
MRKEINYRQANISDVKKLSILFKQVYIQTYGVEGVSDEYANFITKQFSEERLQELINQHSDFLIVAEYKGNLVGVAEIEFNKKSPVGNLIATELNKLYILEWFCGQGIGYSLLAETEKIVREKGLNEMWLWVYEENYRAIQFYERQNFVCIGNAPFQMEVNRYENKVMLKKW